MVIFMRKNANRVMAADIADYFLGLGLPVHIKNGDGKFVIAVLGNKPEQEIDIDLQMTNRFAGIEKIEKKNTFFIENFDKFEEALMALP